MARDDGRASLDRRLSSIATLEEVSFDFDGPSTDFDVHVEDLPWSSIQANILQFIQL